MLTKKQQIRQKRSRWQNSSWADGCATDPMDLATGYFQISASPQDFKPSAVYEPFCAPYNSFSKPVFFTVIMFVEFDIQHNDWKLREKYWMFLISGSLHMTRDRSHIERGASRWRKNYSLLKMILSMFWMLQPFLAPPNRETNCIVEPDNVSYFFFHFQRQFLTKLNETNYVNDQGGMPRQKEVILVKHHFPICQKIQQSHSNEHTIWRLGIFEVL